MASKLNTFTPYTPYMFEFERTFDCTAFLQWIQENWTSSFWYCLVYVALVFGGQQYMATRPKFELRLPLIIWSTALAIFSILGAIRTIPELVFMIRVNGLAGSICDPSYFYGQTAVWAYLFTISKLYELGDTAFIVLRKQPLIFLHWYHHVTVFIYVSFSYTDHTAPGTMVHGDELHCACLHVQLLRLESHEIPSSQVHQHVHYYFADFPDGDGWSSSSQERTRSRAKANSSVKSAGKIFDTAA